MKLSFSISSSSSKSSVSRSNVAKPSETTSDNSRFVTVFDPSETLTPEPKRPQIAPLENTNIWRSTKRMKNLVPPSAVDDPSSGDATAKFVVQHIGVDAAPGDTTKYGLNLRGKSDGDGSDGKEEAEEGIKEEASQEMKRVSDDQRFRMEMENLPDDRGMEEFEDISVEDFSRAALAGYGWKEGQGVGKNSKKDVPVVDQKRWAGTSGLGFASDMPGAGRKEKGRPPFPPSSSNGLDINRVVRIISGKYEGMKGEILKTDGRFDEDGTIVLCLLNSGEKVSVGIDMIAELGSEKEEKCLRKLKELNLKEEDGRTDRRKEKRSSRDYKRNDGSTDRSNNASRRNDAREKDPVCWLRSQIRVRVISKSIKSGRYYLKKGVVADVVGPMTCDISMDESRILLQSVDQEILETVLPQRGGSVLVLYGKHKGVFGRLMEKDKENGMAVVQDAESHNMIKVRMEQIAEYVGDPDDIGY